MRLIKHYKRSCFIPQSKTELRKYFRDVRSRIPLLHRQQAALNAARLFKQQSFFAESNNIACYFACKNEFDCAPLIESIWDAKKHCYMPVLTKENALQFVRYRYGDPLHYNRYSILEPVHITDTLSPEAIDCVLLPLIAYDKQGHRLGAGGGYYDRTFSFINTAAVKKPAMIGLAYAAQQVDFLPCDPWDIRLDGIITEKEVIKIIPQP